MECACAFDEILPGSADGDYDGERLSKKKVARSESGFVAKAN